MQAKGTEEFKFLGKIAFRSSEPPKIKRNASQRYREIQVFLVKTPSEAMNYPKASVKIILYVEI